MSPNLKKRLRVYSFAAAIVVAFMAAAPPLDIEEWPKAVITALGLLVGIFNIRGENQMNRFLIAAIGLKVTVTGFLNFPGIQDFGYVTNVIMNLEVFITAGLTYAAVVGLYDALKGNFTTFKKWLYGAALLFVIVTWNLGSYISQEIVNVLSIGLLFMGLVGGYLEGPKNAQEATAGKGRRFLIAAVAFQLASTAVGVIIEMGYKMYEGFIINLNVLLQKATVFSTTALFVIAIMSIFFVLDELAETENP